MCEKPLPSGEGVSHLGFIESSFADGIGANAPERLFVTITRFALSKLGMLTGRGIIDPNIT